MGVKDWDKKLVASVVFAIAGLGMLIAGSVMLGVGVNRFKSKTNCGTFPTCATFPSLNLSAVYTSSYTNAIEFTDRLSDPNSDDFKNAAEILSKNITELLNSPSSLAASFRSSVTQSTVIINSFRQPPNGEGVNFYASILYPYNGMSTDNVQEQMSTMYPTNADANPTSEQICLSVAYPPGETSSPKPNTIATKSATNPKAVTDVGGSTSSLLSSTISAEVTTTLPAVPSDIYCQASGPNRSILFVIDTAVPAQGTLDEKLAKMRNFMSNYDKWIGLRDSMKWEGVQMQYTTFNGAFGCLQNLYDTVGRTTTQSRSIIIISDGFDSTDTNAVLYANDLKTILNYQIAAFLASTNPISTDQYQSIVTSSAFFYGMSNLDYLTDTTIESTMALWSCLAPYPFTTQSTPPTVANTPPMPRTTTNVLTTTTSPAEPTLVHPCALFVDTAILLHASSSNNWDIMRQFVIEEVIPALTGPINSMGRTDEDVKLGFITYFGSKITYDVNVDWGYSTQSIARYLNSTVFVSVNETNRLSFAYNRARSDLMYARRIVTPTVLVITDEVDEADIANATLARTFLPSNSFVYGIRVGYDGSGPIPGQDDGILVTDIQQLNPQNAKSSINIANRAANSLCRYIPLTTTPSITTTQRPTPRPVPKVKPRNVWPDIAILIDSSFQDQRDFLRKTFLNQFQIGGKWSKFSVATYSNATNIVCKFSDINSYWDLKDCLDSDLCYDQSFASNTRDIDQALVSLTSMLYKNGHAGYRYQKENFLFVFTNGRSTTNFYNSALSLKNIGIQVIGIDISSIDGMTTTELSNFGPGSYKVPKWLNPTVNDQLSQSIIVQTTMKNKPSFSSFFGDFYIIVDNSLSQAHDLLNVQQFVKQFSDQLIISPRNSRLSIVPFSDTVMASLALTDDSQAVSEFLNKWRNSDPGSDKSNIEAAIANVLNQINTAAGSSSQVIYVIGANSTTGAESASGFLNLTSVTSYVLQYSSAAKYSGLLVSDPTLIYKVFGSENLMNWAESQFPVDVRGNNPINQFFLRITDVLEYEMTANFPMSQVTEDIIIILDETGLTQEDFESVKQFLFNFTNVYTIGPQFTQFAMQTLSGSKVSPPTWNFYDSLSNVAINDKIESMQLVSTPANASADLTTAVSNVLSNFFQGSNGWRNGTTTTIIISNAQSITRSQNTYNVQNSLKQISLTYGYSLCNQYVFDVSDFVSRYYEMSSPEDLNTNASVIGYMIQDIYRDYKNNMYPPIHPLDQTQANFIFLIEHNTTQYQSQIRTFLHKFATTFSNSQISVVNYNSLGVITSTSWTLNANYRNRTQLLFAIDNLQFSNDSGTPNLDSAIGYFSSIPSLFGIFNPTFVTGIFSSPTISKNLTESVLADDNLIYYTFAIQYGSNNVPFDYLLQFSGSDYAEDFVYTQDISAYDTTDDNVFYPFNAYIQSETWAYQNTYQN